MLDARLHVLTFLSNYLQNALKYLIQNITFAPNCSYNTRRQASNSLTVNQRVTGSVMYSHSFFADSTSNWNKLPVTLKTLDSLISFKIALRKYYGCRSTATDNTGFVTMSHGKLKRTLIQISLGLSPLRAHQFKYNLMDNPFCPSCFNEIETPLHYFFECSSYASFQGTLIRTVINSFTEFCLLFRNNLVSSDINSHAFKLNIVLCGYAQNNILNSMNADMLAQLKAINTGLLQEITNYMYLTKRFTTIV